MAYVLWECLQTAAIVFVIWCLSGVQSKTISLLVDRGLQLHRRQ